MRAAQRADSEPGHRSRSRSGIVGSAIMVLCGSAIGLLSTSANASPADGPSFISVSNTDFDAVQQGSPCDTQPLFDNSGPAGDEGNLGVGDNGWGPACIGLDRAYYQFTLPQQLTGATVQRATITAEETFTSSCTGARPISLHAGGPIDAATDWDNQPPLGPTDSVTSFGPACAAGPVFGGFDVSSAVAQALNNHASQFTIVLTNDAGNQTSFARFADSTTLQIQFTGPQS